MKRKSSVNKCKNWQSPRTEGEQAGHTYALAALCTRWQFSLSLTSMAESETQNIMVRLKTATAFSTKCTSLLTCWSERSSQNKKQNKQKQQQKRLSVSTNTGHIHIHRFSRHAVPKLTLKESQRERELELKLFIVHWPQATIQMERETERERQRQTERQTYGEGETESWRERGRDSKRCWQRRIGRQSLWVKAIQTDDRDKKT